MLLGGDVMNGRALKYLIAALIALAVTTKAGGCPTCIGRLFLGVKKPFFKMYRPPTRSRYAQKQDTEKTESYKRTNTWIKEIKKTLKGES